MKIFLYFIIFLLTNFNEGAVTDLSGLYNFQECSCTVLRCLEPFYYRINQNQTGDFVIYYLVTVPAALGKTTINNKGQTQVSMNWLPGMNFNTNCTGLWVPTKRSIELKCGDQYRYCTAQLTCRSNNGVCATNTSMSLNNQYIGTVWKIIISLLFLSFLSIEKIN